MARLTTAERRCKRCGRMVLVAYVPDSLSPVFFDLEEKSLLTPNAAGVFELRRGRVEHVCEEERRYGEGGPGDRGEWP